MAHTIPRFIHHPHSPLSVLLPPPTTTPSLFSNHHHHHHKATVLIHCPLFCLTHTWCGWHVPLWLLSRPVCGVCVDGMHIPSHRPHTHSHNHCSFAHRHTTTLWCVCAWKHVPHDHAQPPTTHLHGVVFSLSSQVRAIKPFAIHPVCVWWIGGWLVLVWPLV